MLSVILCFQMQNFKIKKKKRLSLGIDAHLVLFSAPPMYECLSLYLKELRCLVMFRRKTGAKHPRSRRCCQRPARAVASQAVFSSCSNYGRDGQGHLPEISLCWARRSRTRGANRSWEMGWTPQRSPCCLPRGIQKRVQAVLLVFKLRCLPLGQRLPAFSKDVKQW